MSDTLISISQKVDLLFEQRRGPDGRRYRYEDLERETGIKPSTISQLRHRAKQDPQFRTVMALARFFGVSLAFFAAELTHDEAIAYLADPANTAYLDTVRARRAETVVQKSEHKRDLLAMRAAYLDDEGVQAVANMIDYILLQRGIRVGEAETESSSEQSTDATINQDADL